jgi:hypothetical protein
MNDEYLWSKEGNDREIEILEDLLSEFRFVPGSVQILPDQDAFDVRERRSRFKWIFAAVSPAFAALLIAVWFFLPSNPVTVQSRVSQSSSAAMNYQPSTVQPVEQIAASTEQSTNAVEKKPQPTMVKTVFISHRSKRERVEPLVAKNQLSAEEKYAYDRLMLALSIAGTKLKVVQDTIDRKTDVEKSSLRNEK